MLEEGYTKGMGQFCYLTFHDSIDYIHSAVYQQGHHRTAHIHVSFMIQALGLPCLTILQPPSPSIDWDLLTLITKGRRGDKEIYLEMITYWFPEDLFHLWPFSQKLCDHFYQISHINLLDVSPLSQRQPIWCLIMLRPQGREVVASDYFMTKHNESSKF